MANPFFGASYYIQSKLLYTEHYIVAIYFNMLAEVDLLKTNTPIFLSHPSSNILVGLVPILRENSTENCCYSKKCFQRNPWSIDPISISELFFYGI